MTLSERKKRLHAKIDAIDDEVFLEMLLDMIERRGNLFVIPEHMKEGVTDINGNSLTLEQLEKKYERWLRE